VFDVGGLGRLLGEPVTIGHELMRACSARSASDPRDAERARMSDVQKDACRVAIARSQVGGLLLSLAHPGVSVATVDVEVALAQVPLPILQQVLAEIQGVPVLRPSKDPSKKMRAKAAWERYEQSCDVLRRWGLTTLGEFVALPPDEVSARLGQDGVLLQRLARGLDSGPLVPDPDVPRFVERLELEWPIDELEPLSFVLARLLEPLSSALERADRAAAAIRLDLRLVDRTTHARVLQLPAAMRDPRVLRTLLVLDLESHPPSAAIDRVTIEIDPAPGRIVQYSLLERARPSAETLATLMARLGALVGTSRCGAPALLDTYRPDPFEMRQFADNPQSPINPQSSIRTGPAALRTPHSAFITVVLRRFRPPVAIRVGVERGRPARVAIDRRGMPGGRVEQYAGPWRSSGDWWEENPRPWNRDEWDVALSDGSVCRLFHERSSGRWFMEGILD
jgi:protein ImuB